MGAHCGWRLSPATVLSTRMRHYWRAWPRRTG
jgi:hypothetical protein